MITFFSVVIVLASIGVVCWPLFRGMGNRGPKLMEDAEVMEALTQKDENLFAISELESDYEMGNMSKKDYQELRQTYEEKAVSLIKTADELQREHGLEAASEVDQEIEARGFDRIRSLVEVRLTDGRTLAKEADTSRGTPQRPFSRDDLREKFLDCSAHLMSAGEADGILTTLSTLEEVRNVGPFIRTQLGRGTRA